VFYEFVYISKYISYTYRIIYFLNNCTEYCVGASTTDHMYIPQTQ